jgi:hypothetical protein
MARKGIREEERERKNECFGMLGERERECRNRELRNREV